MGPTLIVSLRDAPLWDFADASNSILRFVVVLSHHPWGDKIRVMQVCSSLVVVFLLHVKGTATSMAVVDLRQLQTLVAATKGLEEEELQSLPVESTHRLMKPKSRHLIASLLIKLIDKWPSF